MSYGHKDLFRVRGNMNDNHITTILTIISTCYLFNKVRSRFFLTSLFGSLILLTTATHCNVIPNNLQETKNLLIDNVSQSRCLGTISTLGIDDLVDLIVIDHNLCDKENQSNKNPSNITFKKYLINVNLQESDDVAFVTSYGVPNWKSYGIVPFMDCEISRIDSKHIISLDLNDEKFQDDEEMGFILARNNYPLIDLIKHFLEHYLQSPNQSPTSIYIKDKDYIIISGAIKKHLLHTEFYCDDLTEINRYLNTYCYLKKNHHYCFIPLTNKIAPIKRFIPLHTENEKVVIASPKRSRDSPIETQKKEKENQSLYQLPKTNSNAPELLAASNDSTSDSNPHFEGDTLLESFKLIDHSSATESDDFTNDSNPHFEGDTLLESFKLIDYSSTTGSNDSTNDSNPHFEGDTLLESFKLIDHSSTSSTTSTMAHYDLLQKILQNIGSFRRIQQGIKTIKYDLTNRLFLLNIKCRLESKYNMHVVLDLACKAMEDLKYDLELEKECQLGIEYISQVANIKEKRIEAIKALENLQKAICDKYDKHEQVLSIKESLNLIIESFLDGERSYSELYNEIRKTSLEKSIEIIDLKGNIKKIFIQDDIKLKTAEEIITNLHRLENRQLHMIESLIQAIEKAQNRLIDTLTDLACSILILIPQIDLLDLKNKLSLNTNIIEGKVKNPDSMKEIISTLEEKIKTIQAILKEPDLTILEVEIEKQLERAVDNLLTLEKKFTTDIQSIADKITDQLKALEELLKEEDPFYSLEADNVRPFTKPISSMGSPL